jgi:hypothetical protein
VQELQGEVLIEEHVEAIPGVMVAKEEEEEGKEEEVLLVLLLTVMEEESMRQVYTLTGLVAILAIRMGAEGEGLLEVVEGLWEEGERQKEGREME